VSEVEVEDAVEFSQVSGGDRLFYYQEALEIELVAFLIIHPLRANLGDRLKKSLGSGSFNQVEIRVEIQVETHRVQSAPPWRV
jgi:hypothetical protein